MQMMSALDLHNHYKENNKITSAQSHRQMKRRVRHFNRTLAPNLYIRSDTFVFVNDLPKYLFCLLHFF